MLSSFFLKTQHGGFPTLRSRQITNNKRICNPARPPSMLLTFADAHAMRPSGIQQIPYDANRSAVHPSDTSAADDRARTRCDMTTSSRTNPGDPEKGERNSLSGYWLGPPLIRACVLPFFCEPASARTRAHPALLRRPAPGASEGRAAPDNLSICNRPARPLRRAP